MLTPTDKFNQENQSILTCRQLMWGAKIGNANSSYKMQQQVSIFYYLVNTPSIYSNKKSNSLLNNAFFK
jgi:hypothetical protein